MDKLKKLRTVRRATFTKALSSFNDQRSAEEVNVNEVTASFRLLEEKMNELNETSKQYLDLLLDSEAEEHAIQKEIEESDDYRRKFLAAEAIMQEQNAAASSSGSARDSVWQSVRNPQESEVRKSFKLPKIELVKFSGELREWLQFWSLFKKIHEDPGIDKEEKFRYLIQSMVPGSRAAELVNSYPPTAENYKNVIESLTLRFGREDLLIEVYVRDLLQLVLQNSGGNARNLALSTLHDKIESYLRALNTLGVTTDKCAAMLYPLVESCLPEELLRVWQRSCSLPSHGQGKVAIESKERLTRIIDFLGDEVQNEVRISLASEKFGLKANDRSDALKNKSSKPSPQQQSIPTAAVLVDVKEKSSSCVFCDAKDHTSENCAKANKMSLPDRKECAKKKRACFRCLKIGHGSHFCRVNVKCDKCEGRHVALMCFTKLQQQQNDASGSKPVSNLANIDGEPDVLMASLRVKLQGENSEMTVRLLIDWGSQKTYISESAAKKVKLKPTGTQCMNHLVFGGGKLEAVHHNRYIVRVASLHSDYVCTFTALGQETICQAVPPIGRGEWCDELQELDIQQTDPPGSGEEFSLLIDIDIACKLLTGRVQYLKSGLTAVETFLGWIVAGKVPGSEKNRVQL